MSEEKIYKIENVHAGERLDIFLQGELPLFSRSHIKNLIEKDCVFLNEKSVKSGYKLRENDLVKIFIKEPEKISTLEEDIPFDIVYEDDDVVVVNKPQGLVVHPCTSTKSGTLVNGLLHRVKNLSGINGVLRPGIVHRLDKDTSGLLVIAKNDKAHISLQEQIKNKTCKRVYLAVLEGHLKDDSGEIVTKIARDKKDRKKMAVADVGREAITDYKVLEHFKNASLVMFSLKTGRTHQIRVHMAYIGYPIYNDPVYNKKEATTFGQFLHSSEITFTSPSTHKTLSFTCPLPKEFQDFLDELEKQETNK